MAGFVLLWELLVRFPGGGFEGIPTLAEVLRAFWDKYLTDARYWQSWIVSFERVGYGFAADPENGTGLDEADTRFELDVDGEPVSMLTDVHSEAGLHVRLTNIAEFPEGLTAGWHDLTGRWYDGGRLILSSRTAIEFVEP